MSAAAPLTRGEVRQPAHRLRLVPPPRATTAPTFGDVAYAATLALLLAVGIVGVLLLNTATQTQADRIAAQKQRLATLALRIQGAQVELDRDAVPATVAARAKALQLHPAAGLAVLRVNHRATWDPPHRHSVSARARAARQAHAG